MIDKKVIAKELDIQIRTLYNWENNRKKLYNFIEKNFQKNYETNTNLNEMKEYFQKLTDKEQEFYISDIKTRILKRELEKGDTNV